MPRYEDGAIGCDVGVFCGGAVVASEEQARRAGWLMQEASNADQSARWVHCVCPACLSFQSLARESGPKTRR